MSEHTRDPYVFATKVRQTSAEDLIQVDTIKANGNRVIVVHNVDNTINGKYSMEVRSITNILGWELNSIVKEFRTTYDYEKGNDVTIVELRKYSVQLYDASGNVKDYPSKGNQVDIKS